MSELATLEARLAEAEEALHEMMIGDKASSAKFGNTDVQFGVHAGSPDQLRVYIAELKGRIARLKGHRGRRVMRISI